MLKIVDPGTRTMLDQVAEHARAISGLSALVPAACAVADRLVEAFGTGRSAWTFGNGGSAADAQHLTGELIGHYRRDRRPLPCLTLGTDSTVTTCTANDYDFAQVFARQVTAVVRPGDVVCAFTTSGRSPNVLLGLRAARDRGATTVLFGGHDGGPARELSDLLLLVPATETARIQEGHTLLLHLIAERIDQWAADTEPSCPTD